MKMEGCKGGLKSGFVGDEEADRFGDVNAAMLVYYTLKVGDQARYAVSRKRFRHEEGHGSDVVR